MLDAALNNLELAGLQARGAVAELSGAQAERRDAGCRASLGRATIAVWISPGHRLPHRGCASIEGERRVLEQFRIFYAALQLRQFTSKQLAEASGVAEGTVQKTLRRRKDLFSVVKGPRSEHQTDHNHTA